MHKIAAIFSGCCSCNDGSTIEKLESVEATAAPKEVVPDATLPPKVAEPEPERPKKSLFFGCCNRTPFDALLGNAGNQKALPAGVAPLTESTNNAQATTASPFVTAPPAAAAAAPYADAAAADQHSSVVRPPPPPPIGNPFQNDNEDAVPLSAPPQALPPDPEEQKPPAAAAAPAPAQEPAGRASMFVGAPPPPPGHGPPQPPPPTQAENNALEPVKEEPQAAKQEEAMPAKQEEPKKDETLPGPRRIVVTIKKNPAKTLGLLLRKTAEVKQIQPDGALAAYNAGVAAENQVTVGDVLVEFNGITENVLGKLGQEVKALPVGADITLTFQRGR